MKLYLVGNSHLDPVWLWRWQEGFQEAKATFRSALDRIVEFPEFVFTCGGAALYKWIEENDIEMFKEIQQRVAEGRWVIVGGWWIQPDCNIPCGEAFVRQALYAQRYYFEKFGKICKVAYNVDSFGHNGNLPQIFKKSGMNSYVFMRPDEKENEDVPGNLFLWRSLDESEVLAFRIPIGYGHWFDDIPITEGAEIKKLAKTKEMAEENGYDFMGFYGVGNHGGGPTIKTLHELRDFMKEYGNDVFHSSPDEYFKDMWQSGKSFPVYKGDLQHHASGCYSAHSEIKMKNRKAENRIIYAEKMAAFAFSLLKFDYDNNALKKAWQRILFNQFHDSLCGCSIKSACDDTLEFYGEALSIGAEILNASLQKISWNIDTSKGLKSKASKEKDWVLWDDGENGTPVVVFNPCSWAVKSTIQINKLVKSVTDNDGNNVLFQKVRGEQTNKEDKWNTLFECEIPAMGYRLYWAYLEKEVSVENTKIAVCENILENKFLKVIFDPRTGCLMELINKESNFNFLNGLGATPLSVNIEHCDTWAHAVFSFNDVVGRFDKVSMEVIEEGPVRGRIRVISKLNQSTLIQDFILYKDAREICVNVQVDWREQHRLLKIGFETSLEETKAIHEIPYGVIYKDANGLEEVGGSWICLSGANNEEPYGLALCNNSKYSFNIDKNKMYLTVCNSSIYADHYGQRDSLCEFMDQGIQDFSYKLLPLNGEIAFSDIIKSSNQLNFPLTQVTETYHAGSLPAEHSEIDLNASNVILSVFKKAEDGDGFVLRLYETDGKVTNSTIKINSLGREVDCKFTKFEIKTIYIPLNPNEIVKEINLIEFR